MSQDMATPPKTIVLATDLSGAGDRALDRAAELARSWDAELVIVHAIEDAASGGTRSLPSWRRSPDVAHLVERQIRDDIRGDAPRLRFHIEEGAPLKVILEAVRREQPDLLVVGLGQDGPLGGLSRTVDELFRRSPSSMLVVKTRPNGPYARVLVGTDYSDEARTGLEAAVRLFPSAELALMHAYDMPYRSLYLDPALAERFGAVETDTLSTWLGKADLPDSVRARIDTLIEHGPPEAMLAAYVRERGADLTVVGAYERGRLFHIVVQGAGPRIVHSVPSDVLVVRADRPPD